MHIRSVELENIKSHREARFEFRPGKVAIMGENGAGKTSIIEAIAWALFDHLDYKKEDFVSRGAQTGSVWVTFVSGLDEREYTVFRDTGTAYYVFDPIFGAKFARVPDRLADKKDEVARFVRQHLGVEPGTDLRALFRQAMGVPQGTFTAIFLEGAAERKAAFDKLLKVEEYRQGAEKLRDTVRYIENRIADARVSLARMETEIASADLATSELADVSSQVEKATTEIAELAGSIASHRTTVADLDGRERAVAELRSAAERLSGDKTQAEFALRQKEIELAAARESAERIAVVGEDAARHVQALGRISELERERLARDAARGELAKTEAAIVKVSAELHSVQSVLESVQRAHIEITELRPKVTEQKRLQAEVNALRERFGRFRSNQERDRRLTEELPQLRKNYTEIKTRKDAADAGASTANGIGDLEKREREIVNRVAMLRASLERDEKFQAEIRNGLCPILSEKCLNLKDGQTLDQFITSQFSDLRNEIEKLEKEKTVVDGNLLAAREAKSSMAVRDTLEKQVADLIERGKQLRAEKDDLEKQLASDAGIEQRLAERQADLDALENPEARVQFLEKETAREPGLREQITAIERNLERLESDRQMFTERLDEFTGLDERLAETAALRDATLESHRIFLQHEERAKSVGETEAAFSEARKKHETAAAAHLAKEAEMKAASDEYDRERHIAVRESLVALERRHAAAETALASSKQRQRHLADILANIAETRERMSGEIAEKERLERIGEMTEFIRATLKESGPQVARNYVALVSVEADQMFGEITGAAGRTLRWNEDYAITLEDEGYERPFSSLSGGEQMAAALSVRLAILKQLSDTRIAFFDEPTTNMDSTRRENLAEQISRIKNFDQLFVISHDDTFENYVDQVIDLRR